MKAITKTDFSFPGQTARYTGKVRDVYSIGNDYIIMVATDRISAFDVVLPRGIPFKGQVLNQIASKFLDATSDIVPNWKIATPVFDGATEKDIKERRQEIQNLENKLLRREDNLNFRDEALNQKERQITEKMQKVTDKLSSLETKEKKLQALLVGFDNLEKVLIPVAKGVIINPQGFNLIIPKEKIQGLRQRFGK